MQPEDVTELFNGFNPSEHETEAEERWGTTEAYKESARRTKSYSKVDWERYKTEAAAIGTKLAAFMRAGTSVTDANVQAAVEEHRLLIDRWFYPCSPELHKALGAMYVTDARFTANLDKLGEGYAQYLCDAIAAS